MTTSSRRCVLGSSDIDQVNFAKGTARRHISRPIELWPSQSPLQIIDRGEFVPAVLAEDRRCTLARSARRQNVERLIVGRGDVARQHEALVLDQVAGNIAGERLMDLVDEAPGPDVDEAPRAPRRLACRCPRPSRLRAPRGNCTEEGVAVSRPVKTSSAQARFETRTLAPKSVQYPTDIRWWSAGRMKIVQVIGSNHRER